MSLSELFLAAGAADDLVELFPEGDKIMEIYEEVLIEIKYAVI